MEIEGVYSKQQQQKRKKKVQALMIAPPSLKQQIDSNKMTDEEMEALFKRLSSPSHTTTATTGGDSSPGAYLHELENSTTCSIITERVLGQINQIKHAVNEMQSPFSQFPFEFYKSQY